MLKISMQVRILVDIKPDKWEINRSILRTTQFYHPETVKDKREAKPHKPVAVQCLLPEAPFSRAKTR